MSEDSTSPTPGAPRQPIDPTGTSTPPPPPPGYVPAVYVQHPAGSKGIGKVVMYLLVVGLLTSVMINVYLSKYGPVATMLNALASGGMQEQLVNPEVEKSELQDRVVIVNISGTIDNANAVFATNAFYRLTMDKPAAVVLRVESGGGGVTASDQIWHAIQKFRAAHPEVPVVASFGAVAASGGYYIAAPSDYIFCERTGITGSIGVLAQVPAAGGMIEKYGLEMNMVIADKSPNKDDANDLFVQWYNDEGELTEAGEAAVGVLKNLVNNAYDTFLEVVVDGRTSADSSITQAELEKAATGAIFIGEEALEAKLVDEIGYLDDAVAHAAKLANITGEPNITALNPDTPGLLGTLMGSAKGLDMRRMTGDDLREFVNDAAAVRLEYRMQIR